VRNLRGLIVSHPGCFDRVMPDVTAIAERAGFLDEV
jgi:hypothetical protein